MPTCWATFSTGVSILLLVAAIGPVIALAWFAWWFLRAGKRYDERERAAGSPPARPRSKPPA